MHDWVSADTRDLVKKRETETHGQMGLISTLLGTDVCIAMDTG